MTNPEQIQIGEEQIARSEDESSEGSEAIRPRKSLTEISERRQLRQLVMAQSDIQSQLESGQITPDRARELDDQLTNLTLKLLGRETLYPDFEGLSREKLKKQYESQIEIFRDNDIIQELSSGEEGIIGIDGKEYPVPKLRTIVEQLIEKEDDIALKIEQGICRLQLVPFARLITELADVASKSILAHKQAGKLLSGNGDPLELDESQPIYVWDKYQNADKTGEIVYYPRQYSQNHQGKTKLQLLAEPSSTPGWQILLIEDQPIPRDNKGKTIAGRSQIEAGKLSTDYLKTQQENPIYAGEAFHTPESWLAYFLTHLEETNQVIDDYEGNGSIRYLGGAYFPSAGVVSHGYWARVNQQAGLGEYDPADANDAYGAAAVVRIT